MSVLEIAKNIQAMDLFTALRGSDYVYPIVLSCHLVGIAFFAGMILVVDLRLLGLAMRDYPLSQLVGSLRVPKRIGFAVVATCGILLAGSKAVEYSYNSFFQLKLALLALAGMHALVFRRSVYNNTAELDRLASMPIHAKVAGGLSLVLWTSIVISGRGIGYLKAPIERLSVAVIGATWIF